MLHQNIDCVVEPLPQPETDARGLTWNARCGVCGMLWQLARLPAVQTPVAALLPAPRGEEQP